MSWQTMAMELTGQTPVPYPFALTLVSRAWSDVQRSFLWSFLWGDAAIPTPVPTTAGTVTLTAGSASVVGDSNANTAWNAIPISTPITAQQFRIGQGTIYNIIAYNNSASMITLDKLYVDPTAGSGVGYQIFGAYYNAPVKDFLWWEEIRDPVSGYPISTTLTREEVGLVDPQRFQSGWPRGVLPYQINPQAGNFFGFPQYEVWPAPMNGYTYVGSYFRSGTPFVNDTDLLPVQIGEDLVMALAKMYAYEWAMVNPDKVPKADYRYAYGLAKKQYDGDGKGGGLLDKYILKDEEFSHRHIIPGCDHGFLGSLPWVSQKLSIGNFPG